MEDVIRSPSKFTEYLMKKVPCSIDVPLLFFLKIDHKLKSRSVLEIVTYRRGNHPLPATIHFRIYPCIRPFMEAEV